MDRKVSRIDPVPRTRSAETAFGRWEVVQATLGKPAPDPLGERRLSGDLDGMLDAVRESESAAREVRRWLASLHRGRAAH